MSALTAYLANGGDSYLASPDYEQRRLALGEKMAAGPVSLQEMADTLGLPIPVVCDLWAAWQVEKAAASAVKH